MMTKMKFLLIYFYNFLPAVDPVRFSLQDIVLVLEMC